MRGREDLRRVRGLLLSRRLIIFDFDGVLADSVEIKTAAFASLYRAYGEPVVQQVIDHHRTHGGMSRFEKLRHYHRAFLGLELDEGGFRALLDEFSGIVVEQVVQAPEMPGAGDFLSQCLGIGKLLAVNSATPTSEIKEIIERRGWSGHFSHVLGSPSSKVENLLSILRSQDASSEDCLFFGDAESDLVAAEELGMSFVGVGSRIRTVLLARGTPHPTIEGFLGIL